jgi:hypothetical protein
MGAGQSQVSGVAGAAGSAGGDIAIVQANPVVLNDTLVSQLVGCRHQ